jgi:sugar lactone lactonase YvrE
MDRGFTISNGIGWGPDDRTMYFTDTPSRRIYRYDFDATTGGIANRRVFVEAEPGHGGPDGMTVDAEGFVWSAQFDRWCIHRYAPDGTLDRAVRMPVQRPTTCMFGGPDLATLYVTSARMDLADAALAAQPQAGGVFALEPGVRGLPEPRFAG